MTARVLSARDIQFEHYRRQVLKIKTFSHISQGGFIQFLTLFYFIFSVFGSIFKSAVSPTGVTSSNLFHPSFLFFYFHLYNNEKLTWKNNSVLFGFLRENFRCSRVIYTFPAFEIYFYLIDCKMDTLSLRLQVFIGKVFIYTMNLPEYQNFLQYINAKIIFIRKYYCWKAYMSDFIVSFEKMHILIFNRTWWYTYMLRQRLCNICGNKQLDDIDR